MEFLKSSKRRSFLSEAAYILLNVLLALAIFGVVIAIESPLPAFGLVLLSKWRVLAVRPRFWFAHVQSNMVDLIVSLGFVVLLTSASGEWISQAVITLLYIIWLLLLKPRSKRAYMVAQAAIAIFVGVAAVSLVSYDWYVSLVAILFWIIGYSAARHILVAYDQQAHVSFLSLAWGFFFAELGWLTYHWTIAYRLTDGLQLPSTAIIALLFGFLAERAYASFVKHEKIRTNDVMLPLLFSLSILAILLILFNNPTNSLH